MAELLSLQSILALGYVAGMGAAAVVAANLSLPKQAPAKARYLFIWLAFDCICHLSLEGSFLYLSTFGRTINASSNFFAYLWQDYARADARWGTAEPTVVSLEILTVLGAGPLAGYCAYLIANNKAVYHFWAVALSVAELYGGFMTFCPEWLTGNKSLNGSNFLFLYVYLWFMNGIWVVIPFYILYDSYFAIARGVTTAGMRPADAPKKRR